MNSKIILLFVILTLPLRLFSMNIDQCVRLALSNSQLIKAYEKSMQSAFYAYKADKSSTFPGISVSAELDLTKGVRQILGAQMNIDLQKIISGYPIIGLYRLKKSKLMKSIIVAHLKKRVIEDYFKLYIFMKKKENYTQTLNYLRRHIKDIKRLQSLGIDVGLDKERVRIRINAIRLATKGNNRDIENIITEFNILMNTNLSVENYTDMSIPKISTNQSYYDRIENNIDNMIGNTPLYRIAEYNYLSLKANDRYNNRRFPSLQLGVNNTQNNIDPTQNEFYMYASASFPIFSFGKMINERKKSRYALEKASHLLKQRKLELKIRIGQLITEIENLQEAYYISQNNLKTADVSFKLANKLYQKGKIKEIDLMDIYTQYRDAQNKVLDITGMY